MNGKLPFSSAKILAIFIVTVFVVLLYVFTVTVFSKGKIKINDAICAYGTFLFISGAFTSMTYLQYQLPDSYFWILVCFCAWGSDIFALVCGKLFGKHKLIPEVSPKKTVEGSIGGIVFGTVGAILYLVVVALFSDGPVMWSIKKPNDILICALIGLILAAVSQIGDLMMSVIKRHYGIKDYGKIFPGHGGVLDRFDSIMPVGIILSLYLLFNLIIS